MHGLRLNPGNIRRPEHIKAVASEATDRGVPDPHRRQRRLARPGALREARRPSPPRPWSSRPSRSSPTSTRSASTDVKISVKASNVPLMIDAYRLLADAIDHPLHLGVTEAGPPPAGLVKATAGMATLLAEGIGDTIRYSLTADPVEEARAGRRLLEALGLRERTRPRPHRLPVVRPGRGRRDRGGRGTAQTALDGMQHPDPGRGDGLRGQRPGRGPRGRPRHRRRPQAGPPVREGPGRAGRARGRDGRRARRVGRASSPRAGSRRPCAARPTPPPPRPRPTGPPCSTRRATTPTTPTSASSSSASSTSPDLPEAAHSAPLSRSGCDLRVAQATRNRQPERAGAGDGIGHGWGRGVGVGSPSIAALWPSSPCSPPRRRTSPAGTRTSSPRRSWPTTARCAARWSSARTATRIWERMQAEVDARIKAAGAENAYFPLFIPESYLQARGRARRGLQPRAGRGHRRRRQGARGARRRAAHLARPSSASSWPSGSRATATCRCC